MGAIRLMMGVAWAGLSLGLLCMACNIEQPVSGPVALTGEWTTVEPPEPLRIKDKEQQKVCLQVGQIADVRFDDGVALAGGQRHRLEGEAVDSSGARYSLTLGEVGGDTACLFRAELPQGPDFPADRTLVRFRFRSDPPLQVSGIRWYSYDLQ